MPIRRQHRYFYPIDWPQLSATIRFERAGGAVRAAAARTGSWSAIWRRPLVGCRGRQAWRDGQGRSVGSCLTLRADDWPIRTTRVVLASAHLGPRPEQQPTAQPQALLPALPHAARPRRAPAAALVHLPTAQGAGRPVPRRLSALVTVMPERAVMSVTPLGPLARIGPISRRTGSRRRSWRRAASASRVPCTI